MRTKLMNILLEANPDIIITVLFFVPIIRLTLSKF